MFADAASTRRWAATCASAGPAADPQVDRRLRSPARVAVAARQAPRLHPRPRSVSRRRDARTRLRRRDDRGRHHGARQRHRPGGAAGLHLHFRSQPAAGRNSLPRPVSERLRATCRRSRRCNWPTPSRSLTGRRRRVRAVAKIARRRQSGHRLERERQPDGRRQPRDQRQDQRQGDDRREAAGQRRFRRFRRRPSHSLSAGVDAAGGSGVGVGADWEYK